MVVQRLASRQSIIASFGTHLLAQYSTIQSSCQVLDKIRPLVFNMQERVGEYFTVSATQADTCHTQVRDTEHCPARYGRGACQLRRVAERRCHLTLWLGSVIIREISVLCRARTVRYLAMVPALWCLSCGPGP
jgi:hypothetical protein